MGSLPVVRYRSAGGVVLDRAGRVLLIERTLEGRHEVRLPKGHIDPGEPAQDAAIREVCEETGYCDLRIVADLGWKEVSFDRPGKRVIRDERYFLMALVSDEHCRPRFSSEREALFRNRWVADFAAAEQELTFEAERDAVRRAQLVYGHHFTPST